MRIFLAFPFTLRLKENGLLPQEYIEELIALKNKLEKNGHTVTLAHEREEWGKSLLAPRTCAKLDFEEISKADAVIAYPGNPPSGGVHIELGWASALKKKIIIILKDNENYSPLIDGLDIISDVFMLRVEPNSNLDYLVNCLSVIIGKGQKSRGT